MRQAAMALPREATIRLSVETAPAGSLPQLLHCPRLFATLFDSNPMAIMITNQEARILAVNPGFSRLTGYSAEEVLGKTPAILKSGRHEPAFYQSLWQELLDTGEWAGEIWDRRKDGSFYPKWVHIKAVSNMHGEGEPDGYVASFTDISAHKAAEERIRNLAYHDVLTSLPNRLLLRDRLDHAVASAQRHQRHLAVMYIDLDNFKSVNDSLGHAIGDQLLIEVAARLSACVRDTDTVARLGGDEFVVVLEHLSDADDALDVAAKIHSVFDMPCRLGVHSLHAVASIGIALYPDHGDCADTLLQNADTAMYQAKAGGRGSSCVFAAYMNEQAREKLVLENTLRFALESNQFVLHYQPIVNLADGALASVEALIRWESPERGLVSPEKFIPIAEETGAIVAIGDWVIRQACSELAAWDAEGQAPARISINISPCQFRQPGLAARIHESLVRAGVAPDRLEIEVTESALMDHPEVAVGILWELKNLGVSIVIDDFGTGYSSLGYLKTFPIDKLKIDRSFVRDLVTDQNDREITRAMIALSHNLGLKVTAEGVETRTQLDYLQHYDCDTVQGYLFSRPVPWPDLRRHIASCGPWSMTTIGRNIPELRAWPNDQF